MPKEKFDNLAGLIRAHKEMPPYVAVNKLFDAVFKNGSPTEVTCPLEPHKGITLNKVAPHFIFFCCHGAGANTSAVHKTEMLAYLFSKLSELQEAA